MTLAALFLGLSVALQPAGSPAELDPKTAFEKREFELAARLWEQQAEQDPQSFVPHYNLAVTYTILHTQSPGGRTLDRAAAHLVHAVELGFTDLDRVEQHPALSPLRESRSYQAIRQAWPEILEARREATLAAYQAQLGPRYRYETLEDQRTVAISSPKLARAGQIKSNLAQTRMLAQRVLGDVSADENTPWVFVLVLPMAEYAAWLASEKEIQDAEQAVALAQRIAGVYDHDSKLLVARDADATLRHEFFHALHHRHADRLGLGHPPPWMLEGLACLAESIDENGQPLPTDRLEVVRRRARANRLSPVETLTQMDLQTFEARSALGHYAQSYAIWLQLIEDQTASKTYAAYLASHQEDPSGLSALLSVRDTTPERFDELRKSWSIRDPR